MRNIVPTLLLLVTSTLNTGVLHAQASATATATATACLAMPASIGAYQLTETKVYPDSADGTLYRFSNGSTDRVSVFVYPIAEAKRAAAPSLAAMVSTEGALFEQILDIYTKRGQYESYQIPINQPDSVKSDAGMIPAHLMVAATKRGENVNVDFQYIYGICDRFVKVRATVPSKGWEQSTFPTFAAQLAAALNKR